LAEENNGFIDLQLFITNWKKLSKIIIIQENRESEEENEAQLAPFLNDDEKSPTVNKKDPIYYDDQMRIDENNSGYDIHYLKEKNRELEIVRSHY